MKTLIRRTLAALTLGIGVLLLLGAPLLSQPNKHPIFEAAKAQIPGPIIKVVIDGAIQPVVMDYLLAALEEADDLNAEALLVCLDTPGGLMESSRGITKAFLNSDVPIIVYVSPNGARAGSAGVFITMAAHIAAMAPGTNIGAATPVTMGGGGQAPGAEPDSAGVKGNDEAMRSKVTNDAIAQARAIAEQRGRNADWAEAAVREAASVTAQEALELNVIDLLAQSDEELLQAIDGLEVETATGPRVLRTAQAAVQLRDMTWRENFLNTLANPNFAYILMMLGMYGLMFELYQPGAVIPGVIGVIALILAFFAFQTLPLNWAGLLLILVGIAMLILEIKVASYGFLSIGGAAGLLIGSIMLFDTAVPALRVSWSVIIPTVAVTVLFFLFAIGMGIRAQKRKVATGSEGLVGEPGVAFTELNPTGKVKVGGEYWEAIAEDPPIPKGERVEVTREDRLKITVRRMS